MRRIFASGFRAGFVLSFSWTLSELNYCHKGSRFFDRDHDPSKSLLHLFAQRLTRTSPSRAGDQDCSSPAPMHLDGGQVDFRSHVDVQSFAPSDALSNFTGYAAARSHFLNETQVERFPAGDGTEVGHAQSLTKVNEQCPTYSDAGPSSRRQAPVESVFLAGTQ